MLSLEDCLGVKGVSDPDSTRDLSGSGPPGRALMMQCIGVVSVDFPVSWEKMPPSRIRLPLPRSASQLPLARQLKENGPGGMPCEYLDCEVTRSGGMRNSEKMPTSSPRLGPSLPSSFCGNPSGQSRRCQTEGKCDSLESSFEVRLSSPASLQPRMARCSDRLPGKLSFSEQSSLFRRRYEYLPGQGRELPPCRKCWCGCRNCASLGPARALT